jgi:hypothetical protein
MLEEGLHPELHATLTDDADVAHVLFDNISEMFQPRSLTLQDLNATRGQSLVVCSVVQCSAV